MKKLLERSKEWTAITRSGRIRFHTVSATHKESKINCRFVSGTGVFVKNNDVVNCLLDAQQACKCRLHETVVASFFFMYRIVKQVVSSFFAFECRWKTKTRHIGLENSAVTSFHYWSSSFFKPSIDCRQSKACKKKLIPRNAVVCI